MLSICLFECVFSFLQQKRDITINCNTFGVKSSRDGGIISMTEPVGDSDYGYRI